MTFCYSPLLEDINIKLRNCTFLHQKTSFTYQDVRAHQKTLNCAKPQVAYYVLYFYYDELMHSGFLYLFPVQYCL